MNVCFITGLAIGDEVLVVNGKMVSELDMVYFEGLLQDFTSLCLTVRSCRVERTIPVNVFQDHIENMVCPPPPMQSHVSDKVLGSLIVPAPSTSSASSKSTLYYNSDQSNISSLYYVKLHHDLTTLTTISLCHYCRSTS